MSSEPHAWVTGSSSGIGEAIAQALLDAGWRVTGLDIAPPRIAHDRFAAQRVDLSDGPATTACVNTLLAAGTPEAAVHAAGVLRPAPLGAIDAGASELMWRLHTQCATLLADRLLPAMAAAGRGRCVLLGSRVADGLPGRSQYAATKAALVALARSWAAEVAAQGVTVNVVSPAATRTAMLDDPARAAAAPRLPPIGRLIEPSEIAALVLFLLSPAAAAITGQDLRICGGASLAR
ncbi:SDR family oxidoreductase [uncultured Xylophilus sp.]|uniref:SDR family NAD(P)-dependent oxidoreductase n=1 Tax=uncultured Xylophilus sp. TaxID=296832 RepID=UPI0025E20338|nr:SDR family oxidoreductase [uncultured Xylophilus sp.]